MENSKNTKISKKAKDGNGGGNGGGMPLSALRIMLCLFALVALAVLIFAVVHKPPVEGELRKASDSYIGIQNKAYELMDASDYLTEMAQRFTIDGDRTYMDNYFREATESNRRENAVANLEELEGAGEGVEKLRQALDDSIRLMNREYYAMRLVVDAKKIKDFPQELTSVELKNEDALLSEEEKMNLAQNMVMDDEYYLQKDSVRTNMRASTDALGKLARSVVSNASQDVAKEFMLFRILASVLSVLLIAGAVCAFFTGRGRQKEDNS